MIPSSRTSIWIQPLSPSPIPFTPCFAPGALNSPPAPRTDLLPLVEYLPPLAATSTPSGPVADLIRLNTGVAPTDPSKASRLGLLAGDGAGYPNGRRLADDVVDITLRVVVGGVLAGNKCGSAHTTSCNVFPNNVLGDGVNVNDVDTDVATDGVTNLVEPNTHFHTSFPYADYRPSGRDRRTSIQEKLAAQQAPVLPAQFSSYKLPLGRATVVVAPGAVNHRKLWEMKMKTLDPCTFCGYLLCLRGCRRWRE